MAIHGGPAGAEVGLADTNREFDDLSSNSVLSFHFLQKTQFFRLLRGSSLYKLKDSMTSPATPATQIEVRPAF